MSVAKIVKPTNANALKVARWRSLPVYAEYIIIEGAIVSRVAAAKIIKVKKPNGN